MALLKRYSLIGLVACGIALTLIVVNNKKIDPIWVQLTDVKQRMSLETACHELLRIWKRSGKDVWLGSGGLPVPLRDLNPQATQVLDYEEFVVVNIKLVTGFHRKGIIVLVEGVPKSAGPQDVFALRLKPISNTVWFYSE